MWLLLILLLLMEDLLLLLLVHVSLLFLVCFLLTIHVVLIRCLLESWPVVAIVEKLISLSEPI